jgi:hypothetical protein
MYTVTPPHIFIWCSQKEVDNPKLDAQREGLEQRTQKTTRPNNHLSNKSAPKTKNVGLKKEKGRPEEENFVKKQVSQRNPKVLPQ